MLDNGRISSVQLLVLLFMTEEATTILYSPGKAAEIAGPDAWLATSLLPTLYALLIVGVVVALARRFPFQVFTEYLPEVLGKIPGKLLAAAYAGFFILITSVILTEGASFLHVINYPRTPIVVLDTVLAGVAIYGAYLGIECIARQNQLVWPVWLCSFLFLMFLASKDLNTANLRPFLENGLLPVIRAGVTRCPWRGYVFLVLILFPYLNQKQEAAKAALLHLGLVTLVSIYGMVVIIGVLGDLVTAHVVYPFFVLSQYISIGQTLERLDILVVIIWIAGMIVKLAVFYHSAGIAAASTLGLKNYRGTLIPIAVITVILSSVLFGTHLKLVTFMFDAFPAYALAAELALPALILLVAVIRKKGGGNPVAAR